MLRRSQVCMMRLPVSQLKIGGGQGFLPSFRMVSATVIFGHRPSNEKVES